MACVFGTRESARFRAITAIAGGSAGPAVATRTSRFFLCGSEDDAVSQCRSAAETCRKKGMDSEFKEIAGMGHAPLTDEAYDWILGRIRDRDRHPDNILWLAERAWKEKRTADAIAGFRLLSGDSRHAKRGQAELENIEAAGRKELEKSRKDRSKLEALIRDYEGLKVSEDAKSALKELGK
jgi:hypothetical protein